MFLFVPQVYTKTSNDIQNLFDGLTPNRTWIETVTLTGYYRITKPTRIPSYTHIIINAYLDVATYIHPAPLYAKVAKHITIKGGFINSHNISMTNLGFWRCRHITVKDTWLYDARAYNLLVNDCEDVQILYNHVKGSGDDRIAVTGTSHDVLIQGNTVSDAYCTVSRSSNGIEVGDGAYNIQILGNRAYDNVIGINVNTHTGNQASHHIIIANNQCFNNTLQWWSAGICIHGMDNHASHMVVADNMLWNNRYGISLLNVSDVTLDSNQIWLSWISDFRIQGEVSFWD